MTTPLVFITGASSGIGQALALRFHRSGYRLALAARRTSEVKTWASAQGISADSYEIYSADVAVTDSIVAAGRDRIARQGVPDVGIGSVAGIRGLPGHGAYCASKAAVISYCESLRGEMRPHGVRVVTISPGYIDTPLTRQNRYSMPFLMQADDFADCAFRAITAGASYRVIPWQMGVVARLLRMVPNVLFDKLLAGRPRKRRQSEQ